MKTIQALLATFLLLATTAPAHADFRYTETTQMTGGSLMKMMKFASVFARGDTKKQEKQMLDPVATTHYVKGGRLRTDNADGNIQIIDLEGQRVIAIDTNKKTYGVATFAEIRAAMEQAQQQMQAQMQQNPQAQQPQPQNAQVQITPTIKVTPGAGNRLILDTPTNETKIEIDMAMQVTATGPDAPPPGQPNSGTLTSVMTTDSFVAPSVMGYLEFAKFYRRMAEEVNWMKVPPMNIQIADPRVTQGMAELQKNSDAMKGFPMLSYVTMTMVAIGPDGKPITADSQNQQPSNPPPAQSQSSGSSDSSFPTSASAAAIKGLGGLFGKKKQQDNASTSSNQAGAPPANPNSDPNALMEMTTQVTTFSDSSLDGGLFDIPAGYTQVQEDAMQVFGGGRSQQQQQPQKR